MRASCLLVVGIVVAPVALARVAVADGVADELSVGSSQPTPSNPRPAWVSDRIAGIWDASDDWQVRADVTATHPLSTTGAASSGDPGDVLLATASVEYDPDHWVMKAVVGGSPSSAATSATTVRVLDMRGQPVDASAQLKMKSSSLMGAAWLGYETGSDGDWETLATLTATVTELDTLQQVTSVTGRDGRMLGLTQLHDYCAGHPCTKELLAAMKASPAQLGQLVVDQNVTEQIHRNTDVSLDLQYYFYDKDPTQVGYFSVASAGRTSTYGGGVPIAPLQYTVMPSVSHRFGDLTALASVSYGHYVADEGYNTSTTLRVQYKLKLDRDKRVKLYGKLTGARDVDQMGNASKSGSMALGMQYSW